ncbi:MAG: DUF1292 domain-containing protein [Acholeplasmataceae bacterium]|jgi:uncharacterized protein YrzB (UPF0473 family)|nr:DUF1292 domain-containing protein [Acholeplasmataceae bacterium]
MDENLITITHDDEEMVAEVLFTHYDENTQHQYVVFRIVDSDEISAARYVQTDSDSGYFEDIETEEEWDLLEEILEDYFDSLDDEDEDSDL